MIGGEEYTVRSDLSPEYTREVAAYLDQALKKVLSQGPLVETHKAAILAALDITNELFQARRDLPLCLLRLKQLDRKSTRLNSTHVEISYAVFCLKKKNKKR